MLSMKKEILHLRWKIISTPCKTSSSSATQRTNLWWRTTMRTRTRISSTSLSSSRASSESSKIWWMSQMKSKPSAVAQTRCFIYQKKNVRKVKADRTPISRPPTSALTLWTTTETVSRPSLMNSCRNSNVWNCKRKCSAGSVGQNAWKSSTRKELATVMESMGGSTQGRKVISMTSRKWTIKTHQTFIKVVKTMEIQFSMWTTQSNLTLSCQAACNSSNAPWTLAVRRIRGVLARCKEWSTLLTMCHMTSKHP